MYLTTVCEENRVKNELITLKEAGIQGSDINSEPVVNFSLIIRILRFSMILSHLIIATQFYSLKTLMA